MSRLDEAVQHASSEPILAAGARLGQTPNYPFLESHCPLLSSTHRYVEESLSKPFTLAEQTTFAEYLAIATSWHTLEGWRNLSQAAASLLNGARGAATHLAYYASLRAARSILAGSGICVRDGHHFGLAADGRILTFGASSARVSVAADPTIRALIVEIIRQFWRRLQFREAMVAAQDGPIGTHIAAARSLKVWAQSSGNAVRVVDAMRGLRFRGIDWLDACRSSAMGEAVAAEWLRNWSVDLRKFRKDSELRNIASYGVSFQNADFEPVREDEMRLVRSMNEGWLSIDVGDIDALDLALLHDFAVKTLTSVELSESTTERRAVMPKDWPRLWSGLESRLVEKFGLSDSEAIDAVNAVRGANTTAAFTVLKEASIKNKRATGVLARAFLLLRLATALQLAQWRTMATRNPSQVNAWQAELLRQYAVHTNLGTVAIQRAEFRDFEEDQSEAIDELDSWLGSGPFDALAAWQQRSDLLQNLCRFERAYLAAAAS